MMQRVLLVDTLEKLAVISVPLRLEILNMLRSKPLSAKRLSKHFSDKSAQNLNYHFNLLERHGFIYKKYEERNRGAFEAFYQPVSDTIRIDGNLLSLSTTGINRIFKEQDKFTFDFCAALNTLENPDHCISISFKSKKELIDFIETNIFTPTAQFRLDVINK